MRISDWSSDVCSSDLHLFAAGSHCRCDRKAGVSSLSRQHDAARCNDLGWRAFRICGGQQGSPGPLQQGDGETDRICPAYRGPAEEGRKQGECPAGAWRRHHHSGERSEEHTSELQSLMRTSYAVFCLKKKNQHVMTNKNTDYYTTKPSN